MLKEARGHHAIELCGAGQKHFAARRFEPRQHGLKEMHVRVLFAFAGVGRQNAVIASGRRLEVLIENAQRIERGGKKSRLGRELVSPRKPEQREGVSVKIALRVVDGAVGMNGKDPPLVAVDPVIAVDEPVRRFERDGLALRSPAEQRRMRKNIDLARLHHGPPRRREMRRSLEGQPLDEASARRIEPGRAPERQRLIDDPALQARDRVLSVDSGDERFFRRHVSHTAHNTSSRSPPVRRAASKPG